MEGVGVHPLAPQVRGAEVEVPPVQLRLAVEGAGPEGDHPRLPMGEGAGQQGAHHQGEAGEEGRGHPLEGAGQLLEASRRTSRS